MQKIILMGFVGKDPEKKTLDSGKVVRIFPLGVKVYQSQENLTVWYNINFWEDRCASILHSVKKGQCLTIIGNLKPVKAFTTKNGDLSVDLTVYGESISFNPNSKPKSEKEEEENSLSYNEEEDEKCLF